jgi:hypothetical protein
MTHAGQPNANPFYRIEEFDVLCGRDKNAFNNPGNRRFRRLVSDALERYLKASTRKEKSMVIRSVVETVRRQGGRFLQVDRSTKRYIELDDKQSHEKTGHALRDMALQQRRTRTSTSRPPRGLTTPRCAEAATLPSAPSSLLGAFDRTVDPNLPMIPQSDLPMEDACTEYPVGEYWDDSLELSLDEPALEDLVGSITETTDTT